MRTLAAPLLFIVGTSFAWGQAKVLPSATGEGINRAQPFDRKVPDPSVYAGRVFFVWGAQKPTTAGPAIPSKYLPYSRDPDRTHTLEWYKANHPEWVMYQADGKTPAYSFLKPTGNPIPFDISNPEAREWYWATYVQPAIDAGYPMFALDNVDLTNGEKRAGRFAKDGKWVKQFSGDRVDEAYVAAVVDWVGYLAARLHRAGLGVAANISFPLGKPALEPAMRKLVQSVDLWGDEQGFTQHNDHEINDENWRRKFAFVRSVEGERIHWAVNEMTGPKLADASPQQVDWAIANYYLYREKNSLLTVCGAQEYGVYLDTPAMHVNLGRPTGDPVQQSGAWLRSYSEGLVIVNPSSSGSVNVKLPAGSWVDSHGQPQKETTTLSPVSAVMLLRR